MLVGNNYLQNVKQQFLYYKNIGEKAINQLEDSQLFFCANNDSNSIAIIVSHLSGNMLSRWTDFLSTDGEKEWRKRDEEFEPILKTKDEVLISWSKGWDCLFNVINSLNTNQLSDIVRIRNEEHTVLEAINRQLAHYPYHIGQIIFIAKMLKNTNWESLSIPKNKSTDYNNDKFGKEKSIKKYCDED